jgi:hypothetical protein
VAQAPEAIATGVQRAPQTIATGVQQAPQVIADGIQQTPVVFENGVRTTGNVIAATPGSFSILNSFSESYSQTCVQRPEISNRMTELDSGRLLLIHAGRC